MNRRLASAVAAACLAAACSQGEAAPEPAAAAPTTSAPPSSTTAPAPEPGEDQTTEAHPARLAAVALFPADLPGRYADLPLDTLETGYRPAGGDLASAFEPGDEADDIIRYGHLGEFTISYGTAEGGGLATSVAEFISASGAAGYLEDWVGDLERAATQPSPDRHSLRDFSSEPLGDLGDQAVRVEYVTVFSVDGSSEDREREGAAVAIRRANLVAWVWGFGEGADATVADLSPLVADRLTRAIDGGLPDRDPAILGLADPPTLSLDSFAFEYRYGIGADEFALTVTVDGVFQGPDRTSCRTAVTHAAMPAADSYVVAAGTRVWLGTADGYQETPLRDPAALSALAACPGHPNFWEVTRFHRLPDFDGDPVSIDGIAANSADLADDPSALASAGFLDEEIAEFDRYRITTAVDGGWLLRADIRRTMDLGSALALFGIPADADSPGDARARVFDALEITRVNDPDISVALPLLSG